MRKINIEESRPLKWLLVICDEILMSLCFLTCFWAFAEFNPDVVRGVDLQTYLVVAILCYLPTPMFFPFVLFERTARGDKVAEHVFQIVLVHLFLVFGVLFLLKQEVIARTLLLTFAIVFLVLLMVERLTILNIVRRFRKTGRNAQNIIFVGRFDEMTELYEHMQNKDLGINIEGIFTDDPVNSPDIKVLGGTAGVMEYLDENPSVNGVYCTMARMSKEDLIGLYKYCENNLVRFYALPMYLSYLRRNMRVSHVGGTILLTPRPEPLRLFENRLVKRTVDLVISGVFLLTLFPLIYVIVAIRIKRQSPGPIIFKQKRNGLNGELFNCYKFRSMHVNKEADSLQATPNDSRKFPFGDFMRRTSIDELPQFINVFFGDMSVVGPRPHMVAHTEEYSHIINKYMVRHWVKPGVTGWAQVNGFRGETRDVEQMEKRVRADIWYVENWNFWLDIRIIWRTLINTILGKDKNAY